MTKLEELKAAYEATEKEWWYAAASETQYEVGAGDFPLSVPITRDKAKFIALAHNLMPTLLEAATELARFIDYLDTASGDGAYEHEIQRALAILEKLK